MIFFQKDKTKLDVVGSGFSIEMNSPIFAEDALIPPSFSFPVKISLRTDGSRELFGFQYIPSIKTTFREITDVTLYIKGLPLFIGKLSIISLTPEYAEASFMTNNLAKIVEKNLNELDLGFHQYTSEAELVNTMHLPATSPADFDHIFVPVFNPGYYDNDYYQEQIDEVKKYINYSSNDREVIVKSNKKSEFATASRNYFFRRLQNPFFNFKFIYNEHARAITPFVKLHHVLLKIFEYIGVTIEDQFFDDELKKIYLYNNTSLNRVSVSSISNFVSNTLETKITYNQHVPKVKIVEFLKELNQLFNIRIVPSIFTNKFYLLPIESIFKGQVRHDWSQKVISIQPAFEGEAIESVGYDVDGNDAYFTTPNEETTASGNEFEQMFYDEKSNTYFRDIEFLFSQGFSIWYKKFKSYLLNEIGKKIEIKISPLFTSSFYTLYRGIHNDISVDTYNGDIVMPSLPMTNQAGNIAYANSKQEKKEKTGSISTRLIFYRGYYHGAVPRPVFRTDPLDKNVQVVTYPYASETIYGPYQGTFVSFSFPDFGRKFTHQKLIVKHSLLWEGEKSLAEKGRVYYNAINQGLVINVSCILKVTDLLNFEWANIVKVQDANYLVKSMKLQLNADGDFIVNLKLIKIL